MLAVLAGAIFFALLAVFLAFFAKNPVMTVDGSPVYEEEFRLLAKESQRSAEESIRKQLSVPEEQSLLNFLAGDRARYIQLLAEETVRQVTQTRVRQALAYQYGAVDEPFSYEQLCRELTQRNARQRQKLEAGETVYGVQEFSADAYYGYYMSNLDAQTRRCIPDDVLGVDPGETAAYYRALPLMLFVEGERAEYTLYDLSGLRGAPQADVDAVVRAIRQELSGRTDRDVIWNGQTFRAQAVSWDTEQLRALVRQDPDGERILPGRMEEGTSELFCTDSLWAVIRLEGFVKAESLSEQEADVLQARMRDEAYQALVERLSRQAAVRSRKKGIERIIQSMYGA